MMTECFEMLVVETLEESYSLETKSFQCSRGTDGNKPSISSSILFLEKIEICIFAYSYMRSISILL